MLINIILLEPLLLLVIQTICMINKNTIITGDNSGRIRQYQKNGDNLIFIYENEKAHNLPINSLIKLSNNHFASCSEDSTIKIWQKWIIGLNNNYINLFNNIII